MTTPAAPDQICVRELRVACVIGILPEERTRNQGVIVDAEIWLDLTAAGAATELAATVDYFALARAMEHVLKAGKFRLLESAAMALTAFCLAQAAKPVKARVTIGKPEALKGNGLASVTIERSRADVDAWRRPGGILFSCPDCSLAISSDFVPEIRGPLR